MFGDQCCTFIPHNTAADGSGTRGLEGLCTLSEEMTEHSGTDNPHWENGWTKCFPLKGSSPCCIKWAQSRKEASR